MLQPVLHTAQPVQAETTGTSASDAADASTAFGLVLGAIQSAQAENPPAQEGAIPPENTDAEPASLLEATLGATAALIFQMPPVAVAQAGVDPSTGLTPGASSDSSEADFAMPPQQNLPPDPADLAALTAQASPLNPLANDPIGQPPLVADWAGRAATLQLAAGVAGLASTARAASGTTAAPASTSMVSTNSASASTTTVEAIADVPVAQTNPVTALAALFANNAKDSVAAQSVVQGGTPTSTMPALATTAPLQTPGSVLFEASRQAVSGQTATDQAASGADPLLLGKPLELLANRVLAAVADAPPNVGRPVTASSQTLPVGDTANPASLGALAGPATPASDPAQSASRVVSHVAAPLLSREWRNELSDRVAWMVGRQAQSAEIILNPPALGSIEVRLNMNLAGNEAGAQFFSANANVRDALESAFPRLRELMANMGITLGEASVSSQSFGERPTGSESGQTSGKGVEPALFSAAVPGAVLTGTARSQGLVDLYI